MIWVFYLNDLQTDGKHWTVQLILLSVIISWSDRFQFRSLTAADEQHFDFHMWNNSVCLETIKIFFPGWLWVGKTNGRLTGVQGRNNFSQLKENIKCSFKCCFTVVSLRWLSLNLWTGSKHLRHCCPQIKQKVAGSAWNLREFTCMTLFRYSIGKSLYEYLNKL